MTTPVLILPGWQNSEASHWQSRWEAIHGDRRVEQADWLRPARADWIARLEDVLVREPVPVLLVAHSLGCHLVAAWASQSQHTARVQAALLVAPPDTERADMPTEVHDWRPLPRQRLPFASTVVASSDDPFCSHARAKGLAADWGADLVEVGPRGHLNAASGLGDWPAGRQLLEALRVRSG